MILPLFITFHLFVDPHHFPYIATISCRVRPCGPDGEIEMSRSVIGRQDAMREVHNARYGGKIKKLVMGRLALASPSFFSFKE